MSEAHRVLVASYSTRECESYQFEKYDLNDTCTLINKKNNFFFQWRWKREGRDHLPTNYAPVALPSCTWSCADAKARSRHHLHLHGVALRLSSRCALVNLAQLAKEFQGLFIEDTKSDCRTNFPVFFARQNRCFSFSFVVACGGCQRGRSSPQTTAKNNMSLASSQSQFLKGAANGAAALSKNDGASRRKTSGSAVVARANRGGAHDNTDAAPDDKEQVLDGDASSLRQQLVSGMAASAIFANAAVAPVSLAQEVYGAQQDGLAESILPEVSGDGRWDDDRCK